MAVSSEVEKFDEGGPKAMSEQQSDLAVGRPASNPAASEEPTDTCHFFSRAVQFILEAIGIIFGFGDDVISVITAHADKSPHYPRTDSGNAEFFARLYGESGRFDHKRGRWLLWDEGRNRWIEDKQNQVRRLMKETARQRLKNVEGLADDDLTSLAKWRRYSESRNAIDAALDLAKSEPPISDEGEGWDTDSFLFGVGNGIVDLRTGKARKAVRSDRITKFSSVSFDSTAKCPRFNDFISQIFGGDGTRVAYIQKAVGYSLTGNVREQCLFACYGEGSNGKTTLLEILFYILGEHAVDLPFSVLESKQYGNAPGEGINLPGARFAKVVEIREGRRLDEARIKSWTGGDTMTVRPLYKHAFSFQPTHKLWLAFNHKPVISDGSPAMWRRIHLIPFLLRFEGEQKERGLLDQLKTEASGILNWAIEGCLLWQKEGLTAPAIVREATQQYQNESDALAPFLEDCCAIDAATFVGKTDLWNAYSEWAKTEKTALPRTVFTERLKSRGFTPGEQGHDKILVWRGLGLRADAGEQVGAGAHLHNSSYTSPDKKVSEKDYPQAPADKADAENTELNGVNAGCRQ